MRIYGKLLLVGILMSLGADSLAAEATPAVVNSALRSALSQTMSLDGSWDFAMDPDKKGDDEKWFNPDVALPNKIDIQVPGCWEAQGVGGPGTSFSATPEQANRPLIGSYMGTAWYKKTVTIPNEWKGKEIWLKFGGVHCQGWFWANGTYLNHDKSYCGSYKYRVTDLVDANGDLVIAVKVRNDVPSGKGLFGYLHRFGGLYRSVELDATPKQLIDYAYVEGDLDAQSARVHVKLRSTQAAQKQVEVQVRISTLDGKLAGQSRQTLTLKGNQIKDVVLDATLKPFKAWSPKHPNLYRADIVLKRNGKKTDGWVERFGVRKWEVRGSDFYLNNRKHMVRGFGDDYVYPLTIASPADKSIHVQHMSVAKQFGFNYVRKHTHCEIPEYYDAADEVGIMVQPELPYYGSNPSANAKGWFRPKEDMAELVTHYRRYVSLSTYCTGNEGHLGSPIDEQVYNLAKTMDPTRLVLHQDGGHNTAANSDFGTGPLNIWVPGAKAPRPWFAHEYLNLAVEKDPRLAWKFTGSQLPSVLDDDYDAKLAAAGLDIGWKDDMLDSGYYLQRLWQKIGLESARLDPDCDGYIYWTIVNLNFYADQGLFDQFWDVKKTTPEFFNQFNSSTTILAAHKQRPIGADQRILAEGDTLDVDWWISHFEETPLNNATLTWRLEADSVVLGSGTVTNVNAVNGEIKQIGKTSFTIPKISILVKADLIVEIEGTSVKNSWELWLFPQFVPQADSGDGIAASAKVYDLIASRYPGIVLLGKSEAKNAKLIITDSMEDAFFDALDNGKSVILVELMGIKPGVGPGWWVVGRQAGTVISDHAAFGDFPHQGYLNQLFFRLVNNAVNCGDQEYRHVQKLIVNSGSTGYCAHVFEAKASDGKLLACGFDVLNDNVEAAYLLDQFIKYSRSSRFSPQGEFNMKNPRLRWEKTNLLLSKPAPPMPDVQISDLKALKASSGWGQPVMNRAVTGKPLRVYGKVWPKGIGVHAKSELVYECKPNYTRFVAKVGLDEEVSGRLTSLDFVVYADNTEIARSSVLRWDLMTFWHIDAAIPKGTKRIRLVVGDGGDGGWDHGDWVNAGFMLN